MINWFLKHWKVVILIPIIIISITVWISLTSEHWLSALILKYFDSWSIALSAAMMSLLAFAAFWTIVENRRIREEQNQEERRRLALERIRGWAEVVCELITRPTSRATILEERLAELDVWLQTTGGRSLGVLGDAEQLGGDLNSYVKGAHLAIFEFVARLRGDDAIAAHKSEYKIEYELKPIGSLGELLEAKRELMRTLGDVIDSATKRLVPLI